MWPGLDSRETAALTAVYKVHHSCDASAAAVQKDNQMSRFEYQSIIVPSVKEKKRIIATVIALVELSVFV